MSLPGYVDSVSKPNPGVGRIDMSFTSYSERQLLHVCSDVHFDHAGCRRDVWKRHLDSCCEQGGMVIIVGDLFCAMQGKWDKRADRSALREEYQHGPYLDRLVDVQYEFLLPYRNHLAFISRGNHESGIYKHHETDLTANLCARLRAAGSPVIDMPYKGWYRLHGRLHKTCTDSLKVHYTHGYGGGGEVTKDMIQKHRQLAHCDGADMMLSGHTHDLWACPYVCLRLTDSDRIEQREGLYLKCGNYKDAFLDGKGDGFEAERGHAPKPIGSWFVDIGFTGPNRRMTIDHRRAR